MMWMEYECRMRTENLSSAVLVDGTSGKLSAISCCSSKQSYMLLWVFASSSVVNGLLCLRECCGSCE